MAASCLTPKMLCLISKHSVEIPDQVGNDRLVRKDGKFRATLHMDFLFFAKAQRLRRLPEYNGQSGRMRDLLLEYHSKCNLH